MPTALGAFRSYIFTPKPFEITFAERGFPATDPEIRRKLEIIPLQVIVGFDFGMQGRDEDEIALLLSTLEREHRGFGYEGATMALVIRDLLPLGPSNRTERFLRGAAAPHIFLAYIGIGFAMGRLPRRVWAKAVPDLTGVPLNSTLSWLAVDGYGFHQAYFHTKKWVYDAYVGPNYPWDGAPEYFGRAVDQGIGRALWFCAGADMGRAVGLVDRFTPDRHADLWSGLGLAAAFSGAGEERELKALRARSKNLYPHLAQGVVFAAKARAHAGSRTEHTEMAVNALTDSSVSALAELADEASEYVDPDSDVPLYEQWRQRTRQEFS